MFSSLPRMSLISGTFLCTVGRPRRRLDDNIRMDLKEVGTYQYKELG